MSFRLTFMRRQTTVLRMHDREVVAAIVGGDPAGLAEAYDTYAAALYSYCRFMLPPSAGDGAAASSGTFGDLSGRGGTGGSGGGSRGRGGPDGLGDEAAEVVRDTFIVAMSKLGGLRDPDRLGDWLHAVARNECLRRLQARNPGGTVKAADPGGTAPQAALPDGLKEQVLQACAASTPAGRAYGVSVVHRAGAFDRTGFPRPVGPQGPEWWRRARRRPQVLAAAGAFVMAAAVAGIIVALTAGGSHRTPAATVALGGGGVPRGSSAAPTTPAPSPTPHHTARRGQATPTPLAPTPGDGQSTAPAAPTTPPAASPSPSPSPSPSASPSPSPSPSPTPGYLVASPVRLALTSTPGKPASGTFTLTAEDGPVGNFTIVVPTGKLAVFPRSGSLGPGDSAVITVRATSKVSFSAQLIINPGGLVVTVTLTIKIVVKA
jgi:hypothetical protein